MVAIWASSEAISTAVLTAESEGEIFSAGAHHDGGKLTKSEQRLTFHAAASALTAA
jgi:hypothetical protein